MLTPALLTASHPSPVETKRKRSAPRLARIVAPEPRNARHRGPEARVGGDEIATGVAVDTRGAVRVVAVAKAPLLLREGERGGVEDSFWRCTDSEFCSATPMAPTSSRGPMASSPPASTSSRRVRSSPVASSRPKAAVAAGSAKGP